jgi:small-conductance mechanosensitive channel
MLLLVALAALTAQTPAATRPDSAVLMLGNRVVTVFRARMGAADPAERVAAALRRLAAAREGGTDSVTIQTVPEGTVFLVGGRAVFTLTRADADTGRDETMAEAVAATSQRLRTALAEAHESRRLGPVLIAIGLALAATVLFAVALRLLLAARRRLGPRLISLTAERVPRIAIRRITLVRPEHIRAVTHAIVNVAVWGVGLFAGYLYITFLLTRFAWTRAWGEALGRFLGHTLADLGIGALRAVPALFTVAIIFLAARFIAGLIRTVFDAVERGSMTLPGIHRDTARPTRRIVVALLWLFAIVIAYPYLPGSGSDAFKGVSVFAGLLLTLGSAGLVGQAMSGLVVMYSRAFGEGDFIQVGSVQGTVVALGMLSTRIRTTKNEYVTVPNGVLVGGTVTNYSAPGAHDHSLTIYSSVTIGYDAPWRRVHEIMIAAAQRTDGVLAEPAPFVLQRALGDWYVEYQVNAAVDAARAPELPAIYSRLHASLQDSFNEAGVEIMSPSYFALRDGNLTTIPTEHRPKAPIGTFRVSVNPADGPDAAR